MKNITVYCGSNTGKDPEYKKIAQDLGKWLAHNNIGLVYGGGHIGLMGVIANSVLDNGGKVTGIIPTLLVEKEIAHKSLSALHIVKDMTERKVKLMELGDAYIALPGGPGTIEEISEAISAARLNLHKKPCIMMNIHGYYDDFLSQYDLMVKEGFLLDEHRDLVKDAASIDDLDRFL